MACFSADVSFLQKQLTDVFHCHFSWVPACCRQTWLPNTVYPPICYKVVLDHHIECTVIKNSKLWTENNIQMQIRLFWPYQVVRLVCCKGALTCCVSSWSNLPSTNQTHRNGTYKQFIRTQISVETKTHEHPKHPGACNSLELICMQKQQLMQFPFNNTTCLHLQQLGRLLIVEALTQEASGLEPTAMLVPTSVAALDGGCDEINSMFGALFKSNLHLHPWLVSGNESLSPSDPQSAP